jgi:hypothetical protein
MTENKEILNETVINGNRVFVENGEVKTVLSEEVQNNGYIPLETAKQLSIARIRKVIAMEKCGK